MSAAIESIKPDLVYDVGLHRGEDTAFYLAKGYNVVAFEANPSLADECRDRFAAEIGEGRLVIIEGAITDGAEATVTFYRSEVSVWGSVDPDWVTRKNERRESTRIEVPRVDFATQLRTHGVPFYAKVDIEGADLVCLRVFRASEVRPVCISIEAEQRSLAALRAEIRLLEELGYSEFCAVQQRDIEGRKITTRGRDGNRLTYRFEQDASGAFGDDLHDWCSADEIIETYRRVLRLHRLNRILGCTSLSRRARWHLFHRVPRLAPGWWDTHARRPWVGSS